MKRAYLAAIAVSLFSIQSFGDDLITLWGPETFHEAPCTVSADECEAQFFEEAFATLGVKPPYILYVINGDGTGSNKASAAAVWVDELQYFAPKDFRTHTDTLSATITIGETANLKVMLGGGSNLDGDEGDSLSQLTVYIQGYAPGTLRIASPLGNRVEYGNSVVLDFPPRAVDDYTAIEVFDLPCDVVNDIVEETSISSSLGECLGGFRAEPDGMAFNTLITAEFPIAAPYRGDFPILLGIDLTEETFGYRPTDLLYDDVKGIVTASIEHFSGIGTYLKNGLALAADICLGDAECEYLNELRKACSSCATWSASLCGVLMPLEKEPCCTMYPSERKKCGFVDANECDCCTEKTVRVKSDFTLLSNSAANCEIVGDNVEVTFRDCAGQPTQVERVKDKSESCPKKLKLSLIVSPDHANVFVDETATYEATIEGTTEDGKKIGFPEDTVAWGTGDKQIASIVPPGVGQTVDVKGVDQGSTLVTAVESGTRLKDDATISVEKEDEPSVDVAFVAYNGQHYYTPWPPYGWILYTDSTPGWYDDFLSWFGGNFDLSLVTYNSWHCPELDFCGFPSASCYTYRTEMPFDTGITPDARPEKSEWQNSWGSIESVCDYDFYDKGSSLYSALMHTIHSSDWNEDAKVKAIFAFPAASTCYFYGTGVCSSEPVSGLRLQNVISAANAAGINLYMFNARTSRLQECGGDECFGQGTRGVCYQWVTADDEYRALVDGTDGEYYRAYCDHPTVDDAVKAAIFDVYSRAAQSEETPP